MKMHGSFWVLVGVLAGLLAVQVWVAFHPGEAPDVSKEEAFRAGYKMRDCDGGVLFLPLANMTAECQEWFTAFCQDHPKTYHDGCKPSDDNLDGA